MPAVSTGCCAPACSTPASVGSFGILLGVIAFLLAIPPITSRSLTWSLLVGILAILFGVISLSRGAGRVGWGAVATGRTRYRAGGPRHEVERRQPRPGLHCEPDRLDARLRDPADLRGDRRHVLRALRRREHRARGNDADGRLLGDLGRRQDGILDHRCPDRDGLRRPPRARARLLRDPPAGRPDRRRRGGQLPRARDHRLLLRSALPRRERAHRHLSDPGRQPREERQPLVLGRLVRAPQPDDLARDRARPALVRRDVQDAGRPADPGLR